MNAQHACGLIAGAIAALSMSLPARGQQPAGRNANRNAPTQWVNEPAAGQLPEGVVHCKYFSKSMRHDVGFCIYLPPSYAKEPQRRYPVIYSLHGAGGDELRAVDAAKVLHEGIIEGRWPEMILVTPNGGKYTLYMDSHDGKNMAETSLIEELIPHVDATYRTVAARHGRCIEGFSMGGRGSVMLAMKRPELFCSLFNQAGNVYRVAEQFDDPNTPASVKESLGPDKRRYVENDPFLNLEKNLGKIKGQLRIQMFCGTQDDHLPTIRDFHAALLKAGVDHTYLEIEGLAHERGKMIAQYGPVWFSYHAESLRLAALTAR